MKIIPAEIAQLGEIGYIVRDNSIQEVMVVGIAFDSKERRRVLYTVESYRKGDEGQDFYNVIQNVSRHEFHHDIASAVAGIPIRKYVKRK